MSARRCTKHPHKSKGAADAQLRALLKLDNDTRNTVELCTYLCACGWWHVGHNEMRIRPEPMPPLLPLRRRAGGRTRRAQ
jgi:hypothetical protein